MGILGGRDSTRSLQYLRMRVFCDGAHRQKHRQTDIVTSRLNRPKGRFSENKGQPIWKIKVKIFKGSTSTDLTSSKQDIEPELLNTIVGFWGALLFGWCSSMVSMSLFLKSGPCFILSSKGPLAGILTWKFLLVVITLPCQVNMKILTTHYTFGYFLFSSACICTLSFLLALFSLYKAVGCWKTLLRIISSYPALLLLPVFTCFTFGSYKDGEDGLALSWKWTGVNILVSYFGATLRMLLELELFETKFDCYLIFNPKTTTYGGLRFYYALGSNCLAILLTVLLFYSKLEYGVLLPSHPESPHVLEAGAVVPLVTPQDTQISLTKLRKMAAGMAVLLIIAAVYIGLYSFLWTDSE